MTAMLVTWLLATRLPIALASSTAVGLPAPAGEISGTIKVAGTPIPAGVRVEVKCGSVVVSSLTDSYGHYRVYVKQTGPCTLNLTYQGRSLSANVYSYDTPVRFDWSLDTSAATHQLKRM